MTGIGEKIAYVKAAADDGRHHCHWPGCPRRVAPAYWGCREHWYRLPADLRHRVWAAYRPGQEISKTPSEKYLAVAREVQAWIRDSGGQG